MAAVILATVDSIVEEVQTLFSRADGKSQMNRLTMYFERLLDVRADRQLAVGRLGRRPGVAFYAQVGAFKGDRPTMDVRIKGRSCGTIRLAKDGERWFSHKGFKALWTSKSKSAEWRDRCVREYLDGVTKAVVNEDREFTFEAQLLTEMAKTGPTKPAALRNNQPVTLAGLPFQFPLPIVARKKIEVAKRNATGHVDIVGRAKGRGGVRLRVFEVKQPRATDAAHAMEQAVAYCATLRHLIQQSPGVYLPTLGFSPRRRVIRIDAAVCVDEAQEHSVRQAAKRLAASNHHFDLHGFFYRTEQDVHGRSTFTLTRCEELVRAET